ncbi:MAG: tetratricopeptide repeat protein [Planctomycetota bacterium]
MRSFVGAAAITLLFGCGGGGGSPAPAAVPPAPTLPADAPVAEDVRAEIEAAWRAASATPDDVELRLAHAARLDANGLDALALAAYEALLQLAPGHARASYHAGRAHAELGQDEAAITDLMRALDAEPGYAPGHRRLGLLYCALGRVDEAERSLTRAHELDRRDPGAALGLARLALERGDADTAARFAASVLAVAPELGFAHHLHALALREAGRLDEAASSAALADGEVPEWDDPWEREVRRLQGGPRMRLARGRALLSAGRTAEAQRLLEAELETRPDDVGVLGTLAATYCALRRHDDALALLDAAAARMPRHNRIPLLASEVHASRGDLTSAIGNARLAVELQPDFALAHERLALLLRQAGDASGADAALDAARRLAGASAEGPR